MQMKRRVKLDSTPKRAERPAGLVEVAIAMFSAFFWKEGLDDGKNRENCRSAWL